MISPVRFFVVFWSAALLTAPTKSAVAQKLPAHSIDARARALFDRAMKRYSRARTVQLEAEGSSTHGEDRTPLALSLKFERPNKARIEGRSTDGRSLYVADGKKATSYDDLLELPTSHALSDRYNLLTLPFGLRASSYPLGSYLAHWLFGQHELQEKQLPETLRETTTFGATALPLTRIGGQNAEGVRIRTTDRASGKIPARHWENTLWFASDGSLLRIDFLVSQYKVPVQGSITVRSQTFDKSIPASTFVFKAPRWKPQPSL